MHRIRHVPRLISSSLSRRVRLEDGQTMAEYAILLGVIALVVVIVAITLGSSISAVFTSASHHL
jgi:Flp pilus assembly pilin Flp